ncbi:hypothetical protein FQA39_LY02416 [Lamprigera yunnana]|nr:hypothetical protein FQA39_LY02416 [Lamprigera yunnana]
MMHRIFKNSDIQITICNFPNTHLINHTDDDFLRINVLEDTESSFNQLVDIDNNEVIPLPDVSEETPHSLSKETLNNGIPILEDIINNKSTLHTTLVSVKMVYSIAETVKVIYIYGAKQCAGVTARVFNQRHPNKHMEHKYVYEVVQKFEATGSVENKKRHANMVVDELAEMEVIENFYHGANQFIAPGCSIQRTFLLGGTQSDKAAQILPLQDANSAKKHLLQ